MTLTVKHLEQLQEILQEKHLNRKFFKQIFDTLPEVCIPKPVAAERNKVEICGLVLAVVEGMSPAMTPS